MGSYHEAAHPHKVYQKCSCGATKYTGATTTVSGCDTCNPVSTSSKYNAVLPFKAYLKGTSDVVTYTTKQMTEVSGEIWATDECTITAVYTNGVCEVKYAAGGKTKTAYTYLSSFIGDTNAALSSYTANHQVTTYIRSSTGSAAYGYISAGDVIYKLGTSGSMTQIFYPTSSGYKLAWVVTSELPRREYDERFNPYCPIKGYPCATATFTVYESDHSTYLGKIFTTDYCTINAVYADGWCQVTYPTSSGDKIGYTQLSNFVYNVSATHVKYTANAQIKVHKDKSLPGDLNWYISSGDTFFAVGSYGSATQVLYPIDAQYGGGYKLGWISTSNLPKTTYTVSYNANGGSGAPGSQTKTHGVALTLSTTVPTRSGYTFVGWATSASATSATYMPGASYNTDANLTLYAVWKLNKYEISYNANGGSGAPAAQSKTHGTNLTLSSTVPTKHFTVTFNANGGSVDVSSRQVSCTFLGWATSSTAAAATYQPGGTFTANANTTLYAVWQNNALGSYPVPVRNGYVFDGWYTSTSGGTQITVSTVITANTTIYARWTGATYGVNYDANGGTGAPESQIKAHGKDLTLSTTVPTREGYIFLGWGTEENPNSVQYQPGDTYSVDSDIMLIAVWEQVALSKIEVVNKPVKTSYYTGDTLDDTGLTLKATYTDGTTQTISSGFTCSPTTLNTAGTQTITVSYGGKSTTFTVTVNKLAVGTLTVGEASGTPGETVTVTVSLSDNPGLIAARLKINYNSNVLTLKKVQDGGILGEYIFGNDLTANPYIVMWENGLSNANFTENGNLLTLTFAIARNAPEGSYGISISYDPEEVYNLDLDNVNLAVTDGAVTVKAAPESSAEVIATGWSGNTQWELTEDGVLTVYGSGNMKNYGYAGGQPWLNKGVDITSVVIEEGVTSVGSGAFMNLTTLESVTFPATTLTKMGEATFYGSGLKSVEIPASLWTVQPYTFKNCTALTEVKFNEGNLQKISDGAFYGTGLTELVLPDCLDILDVYAFKGCSNLTSITIGNGLTELREAVFYGTAISEITIPEGITKIGPYAFKNCVKLETVDMPESLTSVGEASFYADTALKSVELPDAVTTIGNYAFRKCAAIETLTFGSELVTIGECSFYGCTSLTSTVIPDKVTTIKPYAFKTCTGLTSVTLGSGLTTIGDSAFHTCTGLKTIVFPAGVEAIGEYCFSGSTNLWKLTFEGDAPVIGTGAFKGLVAMAYYPGSNTTWTSAVMQNYGGSISWRSK